MPSRKLWETCKESLREKINPHNFESWIEPVEVASFRGAELELKVPSRFFAEWINEHYKASIVEILSGLIGKQASLAIIIDGDKRKQVREKPKKKEEAKPGITADESRGRANINDKYTFANFVVDKSNEFCYASAKGVASKLGKAYNPLFIYGGVGLGKTHLTQAIGNWAIEKNPETKVLYVSSEKFVNDMINSLQRNAMTSFRNKYRNLDLLIIDDIQFIGGKERTQEEFFHTFNTLFESKKQIIISSDKRPKDLAKLEERLRSRFGWGLIADIQPPELELKIAIVRKIMKENNFSVDEKVSAYLADRVKSNIRELEGVLARVMAYASLTGRDIDLEMAKETLKGIYDDTVRTIDIKQIQRAVTDYYQLKISDMKSKSRKKNIALARQIAMYLCREYTNNSLPEIGRTFGGRDHTTVMHSVSKIRDELNVNTLIYNEITEIKRNLDL